jgi:hypothetical protein
MKYYIHFGCEFPYGDFPITKKQKTYLNDNGLIFHHRNKGYYLSYGICFDEIESALKGLPNE